jgi:UDP-N-acetylmuramoylalanine-D-glutamate ligase
MDAAKPLDGVGVLVWGLGRHGGGLAAARLCRAEGARVTILDAKPAEQCGEDGMSAQREGFTCLIGDASHPAFAQAELIVPSPAIPPRAWPAHHAPIASPESLALARHRGRRVGVTGTKGKSTTAMLTGALLGWKVAGNSWRPLCEAVLEDPLADLVCELSSFQLWYLRKTAPRFDAAILTLLTCDHLDWHPDLQHYHAAKLDLLRWAGVVACTPQAASLLPPGLRLLPPSPEPAAGDLLVPGPHNRANAALALAVAKHFGADPGTLAGRLRRAEPLPHRLRTVHSRSGITFVDDSIATMPDAAMAALCSFEGPLAIILGGSDKGADFSALAAAVAERGAQPILIGQMAPRLHAALAHHAVEGRLATSMEDAVRLAAATLPGHGTVLLSPACASFDMFRGFDHRGVVFAAAAKSLFP